MAKKPQKNYGKQRGSARRKGAATAADGGIDQVVDLMQRSVGRYAAFWSGAAKQISSGDLNLANWLHQYSKLWKDLADDMEGIAKVMMQTVSRQQTSK